MTYAPHCDYMITYVLACVRSEIDFVSRQSFPVPSCYYAAAAAATVIGYTNKMANIGMLYSGVFIMLYVVLMISLGGRQARL